MIRLFHECQGRSLLPFGGLCVAHLPSTARRNTKRHRDVTVKILVLFRTVAFSIVLLLLIHNCQSLADGCPAPSFAAAPTFETGRQTQSVVTGDFNRDGKLDLAAVNYGATNVSVLLGNGEGTFQTAVNYVVGRYPYSVATGDFNGDGKLDLVVVNSGYPSVDFLGDVSVLLGNGDGTFQTPVNYKAGRYPLFAVVADFNGDRILDLSIMNWGEGDVSVLLGNGDGTFKDTVNTCCTGSGPGPFAMAVADFNGDGKPDLTVANGLDSGTVSVLLNNGDGTFATAVNYNAGASSFFVAVGDFNGDAKLDMAVANGGTFQKNYADGGVSVLLGNGNGTFQAAVNYDAGNRPQSVAVGDFNADGKPDLIVINNNSFNISVLLGKGDGTFKAAVNYSVGRYPQSIAIGDFDGDGKPDLVVANSAQYSNSGSLSVLLGKGDGSFQAAQRYSAGTSPGSVAIGDFNGDGNSDLAVANQGLDDQSSGGRTNSSVSVLLGNGDGTFKAPVNYEAGTWPYSVSAGDFNGDGKSDLAVVDLGKNTYGVSVLLGKGDGTFQAAVKYRVGSEPESVAVADFNGDGIMDLAVSDVRYVPSTNSPFPISTPIGNISVLLGRGDGTFQIAKTNTLLEYVYPRQVLVGDLNADGKPDLVTANGSITGADHDNMSVLLGRGDGTFLPAVHYGAGSRGCLGDFNGDGKLDLAVANSVYGYLSLLMGNGDGTFRSPQTIATFRLGDSLGPVTADDLNGDGKLDLAVANLGVGIAILLGNGDGTFQAPFDYGAGPFPGEVRVGDFNGDGKPDVAVVNGDWSFRNDVYFANGGIWVLLNTSPCAGVRLTMGRSNSIVTVSWPFPPSGFILESTAYLNSTAWQPAVELPKTNTGRLEVSIPIGQQQRYFRLRKR